MTTAYRIGCLAALICVAKGAAFAQTAPATQPSGPLPIEQSGFNVFWEARIPATPGERLTNGYLRDDTVYVVTDGGAVFSLHAETGLLRWGEILTERAFTVFPPAHVQTDDDKGPVIIPTTNQTYIKDRYSGKDILRFKPEFPPASGAAGYDSVLLMGSNNGRVYSLGWDASHPLEPIRRWEVDTGGPMSAAPVMYPRHNVVLASQSGWVFACQAPNKTLIWKFKVGGPVMSDPAVDPSGVYVASMDRSLYKLHASSGAIVWRERFPDPLRTSPAVTSQTVYQYSQSQGVTALDAMTGTEKWQRREARQFVAHSSTGDLLLAGQDRLLVVDHDTGKVISTVSIPPVTQAVVNTVNDSAYLLGQSGQVLCLRRDKTPYLRKQQVEMAQETLNTAPPPPNKGTEPAAQPKPLPPREDPFRSRRDVAPPLSPPPGKP